MDKAAKPPIITQLEDFYRHLSLANIASLAELYSENIEFVDPVHHLYGLAPLEEYFKHLLVNTEYCDFQFGHCLLGQGECSLTWQMRFSHPKLGKGKEIVVDGISLLKFTDKIYYHRDYYDLSAMLHDHVPLLGWLSKKLKDGLR
ncbi:nuclear transport factor 2 family protein [Agarivorans sp.]|uniref:nuclear transport factor 2 family protein n=1 Tax=Agarivorans sp. TaxID=1872412 RepID=UPI003CFF91F8